MKWYGPFHFFLLYFSAMRKLVCFWHAPANSEDEHILGKALFNLPEDNPREALANLTRLVGQTKDPDVQKRYVELLRRLAQLLEVVG